MMIPQFLLVKTQLQGGGPLKELVNPIHNSYVSPSQGSQDLPGLPGLPGLAKPQGKLRRSASPQDGCDDRLRGQMH